ncbi:MAG: hypothetical protein ACKVP5_02030 [Aestuariivirga sp.]
MGKLARPDLRWFTGAMASGDLLHEIHEYLDSSRRWLHPEANIKLLPVSELPLTTAGKFLEFVCELPRDA